MLRPGPVGKLTEPRANTPCWLQAVLASALLVLGPPVHAGAGLEEADLAGGFAAHPTYLGSDRSVATPRLWADVVYRMEQGGTIALDSGSQTIAPSFQINPVESRESGWGMSIGYRDGRTGHGSRSPFSPSGDDRLARLPDIRATMDLGLQGHVTIAQVPVFALMRSAVGKTQGAVATLGAYLATSEGELVQFTVLPSITWANGRQRNSLFGVSVEASVASGLPRYRLGSGWDDASVEVIADWHVRGPWHVVVSTGFQRLLSASARSPLALSTSQVSLLAGLMWRM